MSCYVRIDPNHVLVDHAKMLMFSFKKEISLLQMGFCKSISSPIHLSGLDWTVGSRTRSPKSAESFDLNPPEKQSIYIQLCLGVRVFGSSSDRFLLGPDLSGLKYLDPIDT